MRKRGNGQDGDLGKPLAGEKRDLGKRLALKKGEKGKRIAQEKKMREAGEMVAGRMASRSATRDILNVKGMDKRHSRKPGYTSSDLNVFSDMTVSEGAEMHGATFSNDPYERRRPFLNLWNTKKELEEVKIAMKEFEKWIAQHKRNYDKKERNNRFLVFLENKRRVDALINFKPGYWTHGYNLDSMDRMWWED